MEQARGQPLSVVLRRFKNEGVELSAADAEPTTQNSERATCRIESRTDGETQIYSVLLPSDFTVLPVDWRRFAYDHAKVSELLSLCVQDNLLPLGFEPWSDLLRERIEATITVALGDLSSVFDAQSVRCEFECLQGSGARIIIEGEHKNGERGAYIIASDLVPLSGGPNQSRL
jgi:hypothetical protein